MVPVDGEVVEGVASVNESAITGKNTAAPVILRVQEAIGALLPCMLISDSGHHPGKCKSRVKVSSTRHYQPYRRCKNDTVTPKLPDCPHTSLSG